MEGARNSVRTNPAFKLLGQKFDFPSRSCFDAVPEYFRVPRSARSFCGYDADLRGWDGKVLAGEAEAQEGVDDLLAGGVGDDAGFVGGL